MKLRKWIPLWSIPIYIALSIGSVWIRLKLVRLSYAVSVTTRETEGASQELEGIRVRLATLKSPKRLEGLAIRQFGMAPPTPSQRVRFAMRTKAHGRDNQHP